MKKLFISILAIFYLGTSLGATIHFHYCMGKLTQCNLAVAQQESCGKCGMPNYNRHHRHNCCNDEYKTFTNGDQQVTEASTCSVQFAHSAVTSIIQPELKQISAVIYTPVAPGALIRTQLALYIANCVFLI